ncbi:hypothetical protein BOTBODRAFT_168571 [Botryobasidium botryosum FD-172 SS1]|uniref:Uncharacterized protein n=1 Tax=Botryobasidium botryosum (strain FD-172 SS1) TaxID=930990 RepID=A0A067NAY1_BOTB1|nr:hypothetical protein BOTBODRAFT_168571 [Botryobasidium botryosum FD-172 SS1]
MVYKKPRSDAQIAQLKSNHERLHKKTHERASASLITPPVPPSPLELAQKELEESKRRGDDFQRKSHNNSRKFKRARALADDLTVKFKEVSSQVAKALKGEAKAIQELEEVRSQAAETIASLNQENRRKIEEIEAAGLQEVEELQAELEELQTRAEDAEEGAQRLEKKLGKELERSDGLKRRNNALRMSKARAPQKQQNAVAEGTRVSLKEKGIITDDTREGVRDLLSLKIPVESVNSTIHTVARMLGSNVPDSIDRRSVSRIALEGLVAADMQSVWEVHNAEGE